VQVNTYEFTENLKPETASESADLPFTLAQLKAAIPSDCFEPSTWRSLSYFFLDIGAIAGLYAIAHTVDSWFFWPIFWLAQGTLFWALFVVGHDCGHRSFSRHLWVNDLFGHLAHTPILVPFHGWRISHRTHHKNTGSLENDESWYPISESEYQQMSWLEKFARFQMVPFLYPLYLFKRSPGKKGSHFNPSSPLFRPSEKGQILTSTVCWIAMVGLLAVLTYQWGWLWLLKYYLGPYVVFVVWLDLVTFLHHTDPEIPWYRSDEWTFLKGALSSIDRSYGFIDPIHHNIGTHVAHHIFLSMPHYHLKRATEAIKPILGDYYRHSDESILKAFWKSYRRCYFVPDTGKVVYYQPPNTGN
jgi:omega-3 fatty acid desaturase (delta-15 desaturase)